MHSLTKKLSMVLPSASISSLPFVSSSSSLLHLPCALSVVSFSRKFYSQRRFYMPVHPPSPPVDHLCDLRMHEQQEYLWGPIDPRVSSVDDALELLQMCGTDPALSHLCNGEMSLYLMNAEDYQGTNLVFPATAEHYEESLAYWRAYYSKKYGNMMRLLRRGATQHVGTINGADILHDESDIPETTWANDSYFRELAFIAANFLKRRVFNMEEFELSVLESNPDDFLQFINVFKYQTLTLVPLPSPACWYYEGEDLEKWVKMWKPLQLNAMKNFHPVIRAAVTKHTWPVIGKKLGKTYEKVCEVLKRRIVRQEAAGIITKYADKTSEERLECGKAFVNRYYKGLQEGEVDPEDFRDTTEDWLTEHEDITNAFQEDLELGFTLMDFWLHIYRIIELEYDHLFNSPTFSTLLAKQYSEMRCVVELSEYLSSLSKSLMNGQFDVKNCRFLFQMNDIQCKMLWVKYGASTIAHLTSASKRMLLYHHSTLPIVAAAARLHHQLNPLSSTLDYSTPYNYRKSYIAACAEYGIVCVANKHHFGIKWFHYMAAAEDAIAVVARFIKQSYGASRRNTYEALRKENCASLPSTSYEAHVLAYGTEESANLDIMATEEKIRGWSAQAKNITDLSTNIEKKKIPSVFVDEEHWAFGSMRTVKYHYESLYIAALLRNPESGYKHVLYEKQFQEKGSVELSLMRKLKTGEELDEQHLAISLFSAVQTLLKENSQLDSIFKHIDFFCKQATGIEDIDVSKGPVLDVSSITKSNESKWEFVTMLDDHAPLLANQTVDVRLPFYAVPDVSGRRKPLLQGVYCLRLRFYDNVSNPQHDPTQCTEAFTKSFIGFDALPQLLSECLSIDREELKKKISMSSPVSPQQVFTSTSFLFPSTSLFLPSQEDKINIQRQQQYIIPGDQLIEVCKALRNGSIEVPLEVELAVGQVLDEKGNFYLDYLVKLLREVDNDFCTDINDDHRKLNPLNKGLSATQLSLEPKIRKHWQGNVFVGASTEEWYTFRRAVLEDAMNHELEWWRNDDWFSSPVPILHISTRRKHGNDVCSILGARSQPGGEGLDPKRIIRTKNDSFETHASINGDGTISELSFNQNAIRTKNPSFDELLSSAKSALNDAQLNLNSLAAAKLSDLDRLIQITSVVNQNMSLFGGKYLRTLEYARQKAAELLRFEDPIYTQERQRREVKEIDRYPSADHPEMRKKGFNRESDYAGYPANVPDVEKQSQW